MRELAGRLDRRLLAVCREEEPVWACWLGGRRPLERRARRCERSARSRPDGVLVTVGEPGEGLSGWRFSHRQAKAALPIAERRGQPVLRYADVALLASILRDDLVATSLRQLYLAPLGGGAGRRQGRAARPCAPISQAERNVSSTAAALGVDRRTVTQPHSRDRGALRPPPQGLRDGAGDRLAAGRLIRPFVASALAKPHVIRAGSRADGRNRGCLSGPTRRQE